jgi:hypothetical protein
MILKIKNFILHIDSQPMFLGWTIIPDVSEVHWEVFPRIYNACPDCFPEDEWDPGPVWFGSCRGYEEDEDDLTFRGYGKIESRAVGTIDNKIEFVRATGNSLDITYTQKGSSTLHVARVLLGDDVVVGYLCNDDGKTVEKIGF